MAAPTLASSLWVSNQGEVACLRHGGAYLEAAVRSKPRARRHVTPIYVWEPIVVWERASAPEVRDGSLVCETCQRRPLAPAAEPAAEVPADDRPATLPDVLDGAARWLDLADRAFAIIARQTGESYEPGMLVQDDLRAVAVWMRKHPDVAAEIHATLGAGR